jgi:hypothetical protein
MDCNYSQIVEMTHDEKVKMYKKLKKEELIEMLIEANNVIDSLSSAPKVLPLKLNEGDLVSPPPVSHCKSWNDCNNPFKDCFNCPLTFNSLTTTSSNLQKLF